ncbi:MAG: ABC transporter permease [Alphaproteobacteria bacterium]|nr:ABC transporter permease [Alphaproteobacteria bacterium]MCB9928526.1 ABC transporter permease [Alphaproteobacteria bacterium]
MHKYLVKRVIMMVPTLIGAGIFIFFLLRLIPGDVCLVRLGGQGGFVDDAAIQACRAQFGLDEPLLIQFATWFLKFFTFDFGISMWTQQPIIHEVGLRFQLSLQIALMATFVSIALALPLGIISAVKQNTWVDYLVRSFAIAGIAMPSFWLGILIILGILLTTQWATGVPWMPPIHYVPIWEDPFYNLSQLIWPALATGYRYSAVSTRMTRSAMLEVLREDYIRTARAKGVIEKVIVNRHALKNAMLPVITVMGIEFAFLMGGLVVTEQVFNLNGLGKLFVESVTNYDYTMTQSLVLLVAVVFVLSNLCIDVIYAWLDPRIRYS